MITSNLSAGFGKEAESRIVPALGCQGGSAPAEAVITEMVLAGKPSRILFWAGLKQEEALGCQGGGAL